MWFNMAKKSYVSDAHQHHFFFLIKASMAHQKLHKAMTLVQRLKQK